MLAPMQVALPLIGEQLWAVGFRHQEIKDSAALVTPLVSSGLVSAAFPHGRGERMASPCFTRIPAKCLEAIHGFSVEDFEGVEDFSVTSTAVTGDAQLRIEYYFEFPTLIWTVEVEEDLFHANADEFLKHFINAQTESGIAMMEVAQRCYIKGTMMFDQDQELFSDLSIDSIAIRRPRSAAPDR